MDTHEFIGKWEAAMGGERQTSQEHFIDLCRLLREPTPNEGDPTSSTYSFEMGARTPDGDGFADVCLKDHFAWEYKGKRKDLTAAYKQVSDYREALGNPPLLVVCDINRFEVHTNWTNTETWIYEFLNADLASDQRVVPRTLSGSLATSPPKLTALQILKAIWDQPDLLRPNKTTEEITQQAAKLFGQISDELRKWKVDDMRIARFITRVMFCMFATDVGLLPKETFSEVVAYHTKRGDNKKFREHLSELFSVMNSGGEFGIRNVPHFNGRLFEDGDVPDEITTQEILILARLDALNWADVEPAIFGTLFERILDPTTRTKLGAHYTSRADMELIIEPVLMAPLRREWEEVKQSIADRDDAADTSTVGEPPRNALIRKRLAEFHDRLAGVRVLDPACGSGNFLYVSLAELKGLEKELIAFASVHGISDVVPRVHPRQLYGIELNPYAVEIASVVVWIGYLQWKLRNVMPLDDEEPILQPLDQIRLMDAIVDESDRKHPRQPEWPVADVIVGNPPFLGGKQLRKNLGDSYVDKMFAVWDGRVARESDLCCYWFEKARQAITDGRVKRVGLLATNSIRQKQNRKVLERIKESGDIFYAQADRKWILDGAAVRVSMVGFDDGSETNRFLNELPDDEVDGALGRALPVEGINANLTSRFDLTLAKRLKRNLGICFMGDTKVGPFEVSNTVALKLLASPNPHGKPNTDVVRPWVNGLDITRHPRSMWIIDFPPTTTESEAALYEVPFTYVQKRVRPSRSKNKRASYAQKYWIHGEPRPDMRSALTGLPRYLATVCVARYRLFVWLPPGTLADHRLFVFARSDDYFFGVVQSKVHEVWSLALGSTLENRPAYVSTTSFETFPFPNPTDAQRDAIAKAASELNEWRTAWLNPTDDGLGLTSAEKSKRTLTNLYNQRPAWLENAHATLDAAVFESYGWPESPDQLSDQEILGRVLALNLAREPA